MTLKVGITGGIGSGKSVVCDIFRLLGVPSFNSDLEARHILETDPAVIHGLKVLFGSDCYDAANLPDRKRIALLAFQDETKLKKLNELVHPAVARRFSEWLDSHSSLPYVLKEAAILVESGAYKEMDAIILVTAPESIRFARAAQRDKSDGTEDIRKRSRHQLGEAELRTYADYVICNDGAELLIPQVLHIHELLKARPRASQ